MCASMADIQSATAEIRQGKKRRNKPQGKNMMSASATQGSHNNTSGQSNLIKRPHRRCTWTVISYSPGGANVQPIKYMLPRTHLSPLPKQHLDRFSRFCRIHNHDRQKDRPTEDHATPSVTIRHICIFIIQLEARLQPNTGNTSWHVSIAEFHACHKYAEFYYMTQFKRDM